MANENKSWLLHDFVQLGNIVMLLATMLAGFFFITEIKEDTAVQSAMIEEHSRRLNFVEAEQRKVESSLVVKVEQVRLEQERKLDKIDLKIDKLIDRELRAR